MSKEKKTYWKMQFKMWQCQFDLDAPIFICLLQQQGRFGHGSSSSEVVLLGLEHNMGLSCSPQGPF